jgi:thiamine-monophosphate kinase
LNSPGNGSTGLATERSLIAAIRARVPADPSWLPIGIGDDAAVAQPERGALEIFTTDCVIEGVHFDRRFSAPGDVGWKALAVNLSDIAAMGGTPRLALLSVALPESSFESDLQGIVDGFLALAADARVTLAGGNISRSPGPLIVDVTAVGFGRPRRILTRAGAKPGDDIYVTGAIGAARAGLGYLGKEAKENEGTKETKEQGIAECVQRHLRPEPRVRFGALLGRNRAATACMDLSDGLADGVRQICEASGVGAAIDAASLPIPDAARTWFERAGRDPIVEAVAGGDDYELVFTAPRRARGRLSTVIRQARGVPAARIGEITRERAIVLTRAGSAERWPEGFTHF